MLDLFLIRHAESEGNINNHLIGGRSNHYKLTTRGEYQSRLLGKRLKQENWAFDAIYSSIAERAKGTALIVCSLLEKPADTVQLSEQLVELGQGDWEGKMRSEIYTPERLREVQSNPWEFQPPGGESQKDVEDRMYNWIQQELLASENSYQRVAVFTHGMAIKCLFRRIINSDATMTQRTVLHNTSITRLQLMQNGWFIERLNDHAHLAGTEFVGHY